MATVFLDPGGDSTFDTSLEPVVSGSIAVASDFVRPGHLRSYRSIPGGVNWIAPSITASDAGGRVSTAFYVAASSTGTTEIINLVQSGPGSNVVMVLLNSSNTVILGNGSSQLGSNGPTLTGGNWYRISFAWKITSSSVNQFLVTVASASGIVLGTIAVTNGTLVNVTSGALILGNYGGDATLDVRMSDIYVDNSTAVTDPGNIWITAKRGLTNGTLNQYAVNGSAGAYGSGNARYTNERPLNTTDFVSVTPTAVQTEEYSIEGQSVGDVSIVGATIVDFMGWMNAKVVSTANTPVMKIILAGTSTTKTLTTSNAMYTQIAGSTTYPAGGTDIGMSAQYTTTGHLVTLNECGVVVAYIPSVTPSVAAWAEATNEPSNHYRKAQIVMV